MRAALPGKEKSADFPEALERRLESQSSNFRGVWFPEPVSFYEFKFRAPADFNGATFTGEADFTYASFGAGANFGNATFEATAGLQKWPVFNDAAYFAKASFNAPAYFNKASFSAHGYFSMAIFGSAAFFNNVEFSAEVDFRDVHFETKAYFSRTTFRAPAYFINATFNGKATFSHATFSAEAHFNFLTFNSNVKFRGTTFAGYVGFAGNKEGDAFTSGSSLDLQFAKIEKPDRVSFHTLRLHPHWFINIDPRKFDFANVHWNNRKQTEAELEILKSKRFASPHRLLAIACQRLAANCEDNSRYRSASHFRRMALDAERLEKWSGFDLRRLNWWYWLASGYGERPFQALLVLVGILVLFGLLYTQVGFMRWEPGLRRGRCKKCAEGSGGVPLKPFLVPSTYSAGVMTLQKPEPKPATTAAQTVVLLETILGPVQGGCWRWRFGGSSCADLRGVRHEIFIVSGFSF